MHEVLAAAPALSTRRLCTLLGVSRSWWYEQATPGEPDVEAALTMGASRRETVLGVIVPAALPAVFDSMRNMIAVGWTYLVIAEIVGAQDGIGAVMMRAGRSLSVDVIMAGILMIGVLGVLTDIAFRIAQRVLFPWSLERRG